MDTHKCNIGRIQVGLVIGITRELTDNIVSQNIPNVYKNRNMH